LNIELWREVRRAMNETDPIGARQRAAESFKPRWHNLERELQAAHDELTAAARSLLERIMDVDESAER
jgi:hypothetical protein